MFLYVIILFLLLASVGYPDQPLSVPAGVTALDMPNDDGGSITLEWKPFADNDIAEYIILRSTNIGDMEVVGHVGAEFNRYVDDRVTRGKSYYYVVRAKDRAGNFTDSPAVGPVIPTAQWFNRKLIPAAISIFVFSGIVIFYIYYAKTVRQPFIRRMSGLDALDEAIGRATEMGKSMLYISGTGSIRSVATIASVNILARVARKAAEYDTTLYVPCSDAVVMNIEREVVQNAHLDAGRPDAYRQENIFFIAEEQFAYAAAVDGIIMRDKPAAIFYMGAFLAESLILSEVGTAVGAVQIAGTDSITQLPFFIATCDYTLMGEELYAASAYLSKDPLLLGSLKGQDWGKLLAIATILLGVILQLLGFNWSSLLR